jgi:glyoxylase-like metal-dependent hydrolase (beta-lactamase superfamily II)
MKLFMAAGFFCLATSVWAQQQGGELEVLHVQGNVWVIAGDGGNVAVQTGDMGVLVVDTGLAQNTGKLLAAIRKISDKPIQYVLNTDFDPDHTGGNTAIHKAGVTITGANVTGDIGDAASGAAVLAHLNVLNRMSAPSGKQSPTPESAWPTDTYITGQKEVYFNEEPVTLVYQPNAHTDGDSFVFFRRSDVIASGDIYITTSYPFIDIENGGSIQGEIDALNNLLDLMIPKHEEEGGTYVIPGHGRICDEYDVLEYRDMITIVRDRVQAAIKKGMTLEQVKAAAYTKDFDPRYSAKSGFGTADNFITAVYKSLSSARN